MKRFLAVILILTFALSGCGANSAPTPTVTPAAGGTDPTHPGDHRHTFRAGHPAIA